MPPEMDNPVMKFELVKLFPSWKYLNSNLTELNTRNHNMQLLNFTVSGGIESDILISSEMGNLLRCFIGTYRFHEQNVGSTLEYLYLQQGVVNGK